MVFYVATRDMDCEAHYFKNLDNALDYVWEPMFEKLSHDPIHSIGEIDDLYKSFHDVCFGDTTHTLDAPKMWDEAYSLLGGIVEACVFEDE